MLLAPAPMPSRTDRPGALPAATWWLENGTPELVTERLAPRSAEAPKRERRERTVRASLAPFDAGRVGGLHQDRPFRIRPHGL